MIKKAIRKVGKAMFPNINKALPKGRITPVYKAAQPVKLAPKQLPKIKQQVRPKLRTTLPKKAMPVRPTRYMNTKNLA